MKFKKKSFRGFTLIELAVALTIVALVIGGLAVPMSQRIAEQQYIDTQANIDKAMDAIVGFAIMNRRLPCPDVSTASADNRDGIEDSAPALPSSGVPPSITGCAIGMTTAGTTPAATEANYHSDPDGVSWGDVPWQTIGLAAPSNVDAWNNRLRYAVFTPLVTQTGTAGVCGGNFGFTNLNCQTFLNGTTAPVGQIDIRCANPEKAGLPNSAGLGCLSTTVPAYSVATNAVFVVYSMGANRLGATSMIDLSSLTKFAFTKGTLSATGTTGATGTATQFPDQAANAPELDSGSTSAEAAALRRQFVARARTDNSSSAGAFDDVVSFMSSPTLTAKLLSAGAWP